VAAKSRYVHLPIQALRITWLGPATTIATRGPLLTLHESAADGNDLGHFALLSVESVGTTPIDPT
jgi:hypothetical protein